MTELILISRHTRFGQHHGLVGGLKGQYRFVQFGRESRLIAIRFSDWMFD
jgi:hypothetical protein